MRTTQSIDIGPYSLLISNSKDDYIDNNNHNNNNNDKTDLGDNKDVIDADTEQQEGDHRVS